MSATNSRIWLALDGCFFFLSLEADFTASLLSRLLISPTVPQHVRIPSVELKTSILVVALVICTYLSLTNPAIAKDERAINVAATQAVDSQNTPLAAPEPGQALAQPTLPIKTADVGTEPGSIGDKSQATTNSVVGSTVEDSGSKPEAVNGASSDATLADAQTPASADNQQKATTKSKSNGVMNLLKSNVVQTFELDPRLQKDLTEGDPLLRPITLMQDYYAMGYNPSITWERDQGPPWTTSYNKDAMALYAVGPITKHLSMWLQPLPLANAKGLANWFELCQGLANYGNDKTFIQVQGGQGFNWENAGWGGADRTITQTFPGVYTPVNGFNPGNTAKMISLSATGLNWTTGKVFGYWQPGTQTSSDPNITYQRGYGVGLTLEKLIGKTGISGIQSNLTMADTPAFNANTAPSGNLIGHQSGHFVWWTTWINKSFQDKKGYVRFNPSFGLTVFNQHNNLDNTSLTPTLSGTRTTGYGYTFDLVAIPVTSYYTTILRFDDFRMDDKTPNNSTYTFTVGQAFDFHLPNKARLRVTFDYQLVGQHTANPTQRFILGFWPIW